MWKGRLLLEVLIKLLYCDWLFNHLCCVLSLQLFYSDLLMCIKLNKR